MIPWARLRAALFVNAVAIREACSLRHGIILGSECLQKLQSANYLFHSALNSSLVAHYVLVMGWGG